MKHSRDMTVKELSREVEGLIQAARNAAPPTAVQLGRVNEKLHATIQAGLPALPFSSGTTIGFGIFLTGTAALIVLGWLFFGAQEPEPVELQPSVVNEVIEPEELFPDREEPPTQLEPVQTPRPDALPEAAQTQAEPEPPRVQREVRRPRSRPVKSHSVRHQKRPDSPPEEQSASRIKALHEETRLLRRALGSLQRRDPRGALVLLGEHANRFPDGALRADREAARLIARCQMNPNAMLQRRARSFLETQSRSPYAARIRAACLSREDR